MKNTQRLPLYSVILIIGLGIFHFSNQLNETPERVDPTSPHLTAKNKAPSTSKTNTNKTTDLAASKESDKPEFIRSRAKDVINTAVIAVSPTVVEPQLARAYRKKEALFFDSSTNEILIRDSETNNIILQKKIPEDLFLLNLHAKFDVVYEIIDDLPSSDKNQYTVDDIALQEQESEDLLLLNLYAEFDGVYEIIDDLSPPDKDPHY